MLARPVPLTAQFIKAGGLPYKQELVWLNFCTHVNINYDFINTFIKINNYYKNAPQIFRIQQCRVLQ